MRGASSIAWGYGNSTVWEEHIGIAFTVANCVLLLFISFVGIAANLFVTWAVYHQKSLRTWNNALLVNLAVVDILRCCIHCPVLLVILLKVAGGGHVEELVCDAQVASFSMSCCLQLTTLACIGAERHEAIAHPFRFIQRKTRILIWIPSTWIVGFVVAVLCLTCIKDSPVYVRCRGLRVDEQLSYDTFGIYILVPLWLTCFAALTVFYTHIFIIVREHSRKVFDMAPELKTGNEKTGTVQVVDEEDGEIKHDDSQKRAIRKKCNADQGQNALGESVQHAPFKQDEKKLPGTDSEARSTCLMNNKQGARKCSPDNTTEIKTLSSKREFSKMVPVERSTSIKNPEDESMCPTNNLDEAMKGFSDNTTESPHLTVTTMTESPNVDSTSEIPLNKVKQTSVHFAPHVNNPSTDLIKLEHLERDKEVHSLQPVSVGDCNVRADNICPIPAAVILIPETETLGANQSLKVDGAVCMMLSLANNEHVNKHHDCKLARRSGYIILTFLIFWIPLIMTVLANFHHKRNGNSGVGRVQDLEILSVSVACLTSVTNPITYAAVNPQFRSQFYYLRKKCRSLWAVA